MLDVCEGVAALERSGTGTACGGNDGGVGDSIRWVRISVQVSEP
jgi:hypothetical protein